jgi:hypothetical protein
MILAAVAITITAIFRERILPLPLIVMAMAEAALVYVSAYLRNWLIMIVFPITVALMGWFIFHYHNVPRLWGTFAVAIVLGGAVVLLLAPRQGSDAVFTDRS